MMKKEGERQGAGERRKKKESAPPATATTQDAQQQQSQHRKRTASARKIYHGIRYSVQLFVHPKSTQELHSRSTNQVEY